MRATFADPRVDFIFKKIFGDEDHPERLISLLNPLLELDEAHQIVHVEILSPEQRPIVEELQLSILDVKCQDAQGTQYVVEMQLYKVPGFEKRVVYNVSKAYVQQLKAGDKYPKLNDVIGVTICNFSLFGPNIPMLSRWSMQEQHTGEMGLHQLQYVFLELEKYDAGDEPKTFIEKWAYFFRETKELESIPKALREGPFQEALEVSRTAHFSAEEWDYYDKILVARQDAKGAIEFAKTEGFQHGLEKGLEKGLIETISDLCEIFSIPLTEERRMFLLSCKEDKLQKMRQQLKQEKSWPKDLD